MKKTAHCAARSTQLLLSRRSCTCGLSFSVRGGGVTRLGNHTCFVFTVFTDTARFFFPAMVLQRFFTHVTRFRRVTPTLSLLSSSLLVSLSILVSVSFSFSVSFSVFFSVSTSFSVLFSTLSSGRLLPGSTSSIFKPCSLSRSCSSDSFDGERALFESSWNHASGIIRGLGAKPTRFFSPALLFTRALSPNLITAPWSQRDSAHVCASAWLSSEESKGDSSSVRSLSRFLALVLQRSRFVFAMVLIRRLSPLLSLIRSYTNAITCVAVDPTTEEPHIQIPSASPWRETGRSPSPLINLSLTSVTQISAWYRQWRGQSCDCGRHCPKSARRMKNVGKKALVYAKKKW